MKIVKNSLLGITLISSVTYATTIKDAVNKAVNNHPIIETSNYQIDLSSKEVEIAKGNYYPKIDLRFNYGGKDEKLKPDNSTTSTTNKYRNGYHAEISLTQNLYNGFKDSSTIEKSKAILDTNSYQKDITTDTLAFDVVQTYLNIIRLKTTLDYEKTAIAKLTKYNEMAEKKAEVTKEKSQSLNITTKLLALKNTYLKHTLELKQEKIKYFHLTNTTVDENSLSLQQIAKISDTSLKQFISKFEEKSYDLKKLNSQLAQNIADYKIIDSANHPTIDLEVKSYKDDNLENHKTLTNEKSLMLYLNYTIFNGLKTTKELEKAKVEKLKTKSEYNELYHTKKEQITSQYELYNSSKESLTMLLQTIEKLKELDELYNKEFKVGKTSFSNLVSITQDMNNTQINYINTLIYMVRSSYEIFYHTGGLYNTINHSTLEDVNL